LFALALPSFHAAHADVIRQSARWAGDPDRHAAKYHHRDFSGRRGWRAFSMFDFAPAGLPVAFIGLAFVSFVGWRLLPRHQAPGSEREDRFHIDRYVSQARVPEGSELVGQKVRRIEKLCSNEVSELETRQVRMVEVVVMPGSAIEGSSMRGLKMREHFGINLLAALIPSGESLE